VEEQRHIQLLHQLNLGFEPFTLDIPGRKIPVVIQTAFPHGHHMGLAAKVTQLLNGAVITAFCIVRMYPGGGIELAGMLACVAGSFLTDPHTGAGDHHFTYPCIKGAL